MGNEQSQMSSLVMEEKAVEVTDFWSHHTATLKSGNITTVSVFRSEPIVDGTIWAAHTPLKKATKNLMLHRHPCILRYISSWNKGSKQFLAVEQVKPLNHVLSTQSALQICIGLHSILKALAFLHEKAHSSHNNVCTASIYVTRDGNWKLGGLEYLCKFTDMNVEYMSRSRTHRYNKAIDANEEKNLSSKSGRKDFVDIYAFAVLVKEVFRGKIDDTVPLLSTFLDTCKSILQNVNIDSRLKLSTLLDDLFFSHEFVVMHSFLAELPLKCDKEKDEFFATLIPRLRTFDEVTVANQLGTLLLSRLVLLNKTAQVNVIPFLLTIKSEKEPLSLLGKHTFSKYMVPKLLDIFSVRDAQIRLLLLEYFHQFVHCFTRDQLQTQILPELLVGIKDTNDHLVSVTLRSLADLVPILGSSIVIGGNRTKLFNDGLPCKAKKPKKVSISPSSAVITESNNDTLDVTSTNSSTNIDLNLNERPSPDGEEGESSTMTDELEVFVDDHQNTNNEWDDWDINDESTIVTPQRTTVNLLQISEIDTNNVNSVVISEVNGKTIKNDLLPDISKLDIKNQGGHNLLGDNNTKKDNSESEIDFFQDMEPVIEVPSKFLVENESENLLSVKSNGDHHEEGWDDDLEWN